MTDENTTHHPYQTITHYKVSLTIPDDETTQVIIKTKSVGVCFATSPEDALQQTITSNEYSQSSYASYILRYVRDNLLTIDVNDVTLTYTQDPTINPMTDDDLQGFQRDVVSANG
jgi:transaldolase